MSLFNSRFQFELPEDASPSEGQYSDNRRATHAAALAVVAQQIGYPDLESVVSRVLASRVTVKHAFNRAPCDWPTTSWPK